MTYLSAGIATVVLLGSIVAFRIFSDRMRESEQRLIAANQKRETEIAAVNHNVQEVQILLIRLLANELLGGSPEDFAEMALASFNDSVRWTDDRKAAFRLAVVDRWSNAVHSLADQLLSSGGLDRFKLMRIHGGERLTQVLSTLEHERMVALMTDATFQLAYDSAYAVDQKAAGQK